MKTIAVCLVLFYLSSIAANRLTGYRHLVASLNDSVIFIENSNNISTVKKLIAKFQGKPLFIDLWASWCQPCLDEFKYNAGLTAWLKQKGVTIIYVSYDNVENVNAWNKAISRYILPGYHMMANKNLQDDFSNVIWGAPGGVNLPHYLIVDHRGNIVEKNGLNPGWIRQIRQQISKDLNLK
jgi:thiol-disulfide isomerase/thioredoxin